VSTATRGLTLTELARAIDAPKSSCLSICATLVEAGLLVRSETGSYHLGWKVVQLSRAYLARSDIVTEFHRVDADLGLLSEHTVLLSILEGRSVVTVATRHGDSPAAIHHEIGTRLPAHCTAGGKSLLAELPAHALEALYVDHHFDVLTPRSIADMASLTRHLDATRARHYAVDDEETALGMTCIAAAVTDSAGRPVAALSVHMVKAAADPSRTTHATESLLRMTHALATRLG
jgi:DNA-binding IclR family transcriptional regulator